MANSIVQTSKVLDAGKLATVQGGQTVWSPSGKEILVTCAARSWIYSLRDDHWKDLGGFAVTFGHTPLTPDGDRFLLCLVNDDTGGAPAVYDSRFWSADWQGKKEPIAFDIKKFIRRFDPGQKNDELLYLAALLFPPFLDSGWRGKTAEVRWKHESMRWDLTANRVDFQELNPAPTKDELAACHKFRFPRSGVSVHSVPTPPGRVEQIEKPFARIEIRQERKEPRTVASNVQQCTFSPSPDSRYLAIHIGHRIYVIEEAGNVIADIAVMTPADD